GVRMTPALEAFDHVHVYVADRAAAEKWYRDVLGFRRKKELEAWAVPHGPLMLESDNGSIVLALFQQKEAQPNRSVIALRISASSFSGWRKQISDLLGRDISPIDHGLAWSIYFSDPDGNPFE